MLRSTKLNLLVLAAFAAVISATGCHNNQAAPGNVQASSDPSTANLAPTGDASAQGSTYTQAPPSSYPQAAPDSGSYDQGQYPGQYPAPDQSADRADYYGEQPEYTAEQPPPPLPDYDQPPDPGDGYIWTPGYWDWESAGYYWVPGVWVEAPYVDALWTPPFWGFWHHHYCFFRGYWGPHIGFYGGVNYGFGYTGVGYQGGYWNSGQFYSNRAVNNVNVSVVHNVYNRNVINNYVTTNSRVSFNGGSGGIQTHPRPQELAALREPHAAPMQTQMQVERSASSNRAQFASVNQGRPANRAVSSPVRADRDVHPVAPPPVHNQPQAAPQQMGRQEAQPPRPALQQEQRSMPQVQRPMSQQRTEQQVQPQHPAPMEHPAPQQQRLAPQTMERPAPQQRPAPQRTERPAPQPRPEPAPHPAPPPRQAAPPRPAPAPHPAPPPPRPEEKKPDGHA